MAFRSFISNRIQRTRACVKGAYPQLSPGKIMLVLGVVVNTLHPPVTLLAKWSSAYWMEGTFFSPLFKTAGVKLHFYQLLCLNMSESDFSPLSLRAKPNASPEFSNNPLKLQVHPWRYFRTLISFSQWTNKVLKVFNLSYPPSL